MEGRSLWEALSSFFPDERLSMLYGRYATYNGSSPYRAPATLAIIPYIELAGGAWYVCGKDLAKNELIVVQGHDHPRLLSQKLRAEDLAWVSGAAPQPSFFYGAKTRYRQADAACRIDRIRDEDLEVEFSAPQWAVTPGQSVVLYREDVCLGGGVIQ